MLWQIKQHLNQTLKNVTLKKIDKIIINPLKKVVVKINLGIMGAVYFLNGGKLG